MSLVVVGLNHRTVPVELLERVAIAPDAQLIALVEFGPCTPVSMAMLPALAASSCCQAVTAFAKPSSVVIPRAFSTGRRSVSTPVICPTDLTCPMFSAISAMTAA